MSFTRTEQESIVLNAVMQMAADMVNFEMFVRWEPWDVTRETNLMFNTQTHARLFNVLLGDFLSVPNPRRGEQRPFGLAGPAQPPARLTDGTYLLYLREIVSNPQLGKNTSELAAVVEEFGHWLEGQAHVSKVWFPSVNIEADLDIVRMNFLKLCADGAKHNFSRLEGNVREIGKIMAAHGHRIADCDLYLMLPEFYDWFHRDIFIYHSSTIAEFLNRIRWAIYRYLQPEFSRSFERCDPSPMYRVNYPADCIEPIARSMYWGLMNMVRNAPYFPEFRVTQFLKMRY